MGDTCFASIKDVGQEIDLAVIATPADAVCGAVAELGAAKVGYAIILTAGFGDTDRAGRQQREALIDAAARNSVRFLGPNSIGLVRPWRNMNASFLSEHVPKGRLALISQSGALYAAISNWAAHSHLGFSAMVSLGNGANIDLSEALDFLSTDPKTAAILLHIERVDREKLFMSALRETARRMPVVVLKSGRHEGSASSSAHGATGARSDAAFDAALERAGALRAMTVGQLFAAAEVLTSNRPTKGNRLCILTNGGGSGVLAADRAHDLGIDLPPPSQATMDALDAAVPTSWSKSNPVEILGDAPPETWGEALKQCLADKSFDGALIMMSPQAMTRASEAAQSVLDVAKAEKRKPILSCWMHETSFVQARDRTSSSRIPDFATPERAVEAFSYLARHELSRRMALEIPGPNVASPEPDIAGAEMILESALATGRSRLSDVESNAVLRAFHIPTTQTVQASSAAEALVAAETLGFPVAMKIASPEIEHKYEVGGVRLDIKSAGEVRPAFQELVASVRAQRPDAKIEGVTLEPMAKADAARSVAVGVARDAVFGPVMSFGAGGSMMDALHDSAVSLPPLTAVLAERLISRTRVSRLLEVYRDLPAVDKPAVIDVLIRVAEMISELPHLQELDINPLLAGPDGVLAVNTRIIVGRPAAGVPRYDHMAISPYPRHLVEQGFLADGTPITIRPVRPEDAESEQAFVRGLSSESRQFRFMQSITELTPQMLVQNTQIDYRREMGLVAVTTENGKEVQQGVAHYHLGPDGTSCEFALVVGEERRSQGIGTRLMNSLIASARHEGLKIIEGEVLSNNRAMLRLMSNLGFSTKGIPDDPGTVYVWRAP